MLTAALRSSISPPQQPLLFLLFQTVHYQDACAGRECMFHHIYYACLCKYLISCYQFLLLIKKIKLQIIQNCGFHSFLNMKRGEIIHSFYFLFKRQRRELVSKCVIILKLQSLLQGSCIKSPVAFSKGWISLLRCCEFRNKRWQQKAHCEQEGCSVRFLKTKQHLEYERKQWVIVRVGLETDDSLSESCSWQIIPLFLLVHKVFKVLFFWEGTLQIIFDHK